MTLKQRIHADAPLYIGIASVGMSEEQLTECLADQPDTVFVDLQHEPYTEPQFAAFCATCERLGIPALARARHPELHAMLGSYLDFGAGGVLVPMVEDPQVVERSIQSFYYPPVGNRSCGLAHVWQRKNHPDPREYADWWNGNGILAIQIETVKAVHTIRELAQPGVDLILFGGTDLQFSLDANPNCGFASVAECRQYVLEQVADLPVRVGMSDLPFGKFGD